MKIKTTTPCEICGKPLMPAGIHGHMKFKHGQPDAVLSDKKPKINIDQIKDLVFGANQGLNILLSDKYQIMKPVGNMGSTDVFTASYYPDEKYMKIEKEIGNPLVPMFTAIRKLQKIVTGEDGKLMDNSTNNAELSDVVKAKDTQIAQLQDSLTKSDAAFLTVKAELADAISYEHERAIVVDFLDKLTPEGKIALSQRLGLATVEDSGKSCREALLAAIKWLENIKKYSAEAKDIMLNTIADKVGLNELKAAAGAKLSDTPQPED